MKVKCPKCRLRFDMPTAPGITEVKCFCPRCGTPFSYTQTEEDAEQAELDSEEEVYTDKQEDDKDNKRKEKNDGRETAASANDNASASDDNGSEDVIKRFYQKQMMDVRGPLILRDEYNHSFRHTIFFIIGIIIMIFLVGFAAKGLDVAVGHFTDKDEATSQSIAIDSVLRANAKEAKYENAKNRKKRREISGRKKKDEALPHWLQGEWHLQTKDNDIVMNIQGTGIAVSDKEHTNIGSVHRYGTTLVCKFFDGRTFEYGLDMKRHCIILDRGRRMKKIKSRE